MYEALSERGRGRERGRSKNIDPLFVIQYMYMMTLGAQTKGFHLLQVSCIACIPNRVRQVSRIPSRKDCMKNFSYHE